MFHSQASRPIFSKLHFCPYYGSLRYHGSKVGRHVCRLELGIGSGVPLRARRRMLGALPWPRKRAESRPARALRMRTPDRPASRDSASASMAAILGASSLRLRALQICSEPQLPLPLVLVFRPSSHRDPPLNRVLALRLFGPSVLADS